jgi:hypothetical protein
MTSYITSLIAVCYIVEHSWLLFQMQNYVVLPILCPTFELTNILNTRLQIKQYIWCCDYHEVNVLNVYLISNDGFELYDLATLP